MGGRGRILLDSLSGYDATIGRGPIDRHLVLAAQRRRHALLRALVSAVMFVFALACLLGATPGRADGTDREQMRGLDEQVQEIKSDVLGISAELGQLEEKLLYPSDTQVAVFVALAPQDKTRLDAVRVQIDGQLVAHYIYSFKELDALRRGGVQRLYVGNVATGDHKIEVQVDGKSTGGADFSHQEQFTFNKGVGPKLVGLTVAGPDSGHAPIELGNW
jgi:hypothetical protein